MKTLNPNARKQYGAALPVALAMLLISTIIGLASIRSTTEQAKMSSNMYDRSLAHQAAEAALQEAERAIAKLTLNDKKKIGKNCLSQDDIVRLGTNEQVAGTCPSIPISTFTEDIDTNWTAVPLVPTDKDKAFLTAGLAPQYYIERMGLVKPVRYSDNDNAYNSDFSQEPLLLYRVTARSGAPSSNNSRSIIALQITAKTNL